MASSNSLSSSSLPKNAPSSRTAAFEKVVKAIAPDIPLLMHGSGDVYPHEVNLDTAGLVAELTAQYIARLVEAAVEAHETLTDGAETNGGHLLLPPPPKRYRTPLPPPLLDQRIALSADSPNDHSSANNHHRKRRKAGQQYWDDPLPDPVIRNDTDTKPTPSNSHQDWVGLAGVDFFETTRTRKAFATTSSVIGTQCFVFPICHDPQLYGRVMEVQSERRNLAPELIDSVIMDLVRTEGIKKKKTKSSKEKTEAGENNDEDEEEEMEDEPKWPIDTFLLTYQAEET